MFKHPTGRREAFVDGLPQSQRASVTQARGNSRRLPRGHGNGKRETGETKNDCGGGQHTLINCGSLEVLVALII